MLLMEMSIIQIPYSSIVTIELKKKKKKRQCNSAKEEWHVTTILLKIIQLSNSFITQTFWKFKISIPTKTHTATGARHTQNTEKYNTSQINLKWQTPNLKLRANHQTRRIGNKSKKVQTNSCRI